MKGHVYRYLIGFISFISENRFGCIVTQCNIFTTKLYLQTSSDTANSWTVYGLVLSGFAESLEY